jgi:uncharacterized membrane protein YhiD involved in acid resistance
VIRNIELLSRLVLAALLGSVTGFERERLNWAAAASSVRPLDDPCQL